MKLHDFFPYLAIWMIPAATFAQTHIEWDPVQQVSFDTLEAADPTVWAFGDTIHAFWHAILQDQIKYVRSTDRGHTWSPARSVLADPPVGNNGSTYWDAVAGNNIYAVWQTCDTCDAQTQHLFVTFRRSTDAGTTFEPYHRLFSGSVNIYSTSASDSFVVYLHKLEPVSFFTTLIEVSSDFGVTWLRRETPFVNFQHVKVVGSDMYWLEPAAGTLSREVSYRYSNDLGATWTPLFELTADDGYSSDLADVDATRDGHVFVVWRDAKYGSTNGFGGTILLRCSSDRGQSWGQEVRLNQIPSGVLPRVVSDRQLVVIVWHNEGQPFAGISLRLSTNDGDTWLPEMSASDSTVQARAAYAAIVGNDIYVVWERDTQTQPLEVFFRRGHIVTTEVPEGQKVSYQFRLDQNYPNPFNSSTLVSFTLPTRCFVNLSICDLLGRTMKVLVRGDEEAGRHQANFEGGELATGVYFARLEAGNKVVIKPMVLIK